MTPESFVRKLRNLAEAPQPEREIRQAAAQLLRTLIELPPEEIEKNYQDFDRRLFMVYTPPETTPPEKRQNAAEGCPGGEGPQNGICPNSGLPCMVKVSHPASFLAGKEVGEKIRDLRAGRCSTGVFEKDLTRLFTGENRLSPQP
ncbi:MAG: hypothetical protein LAT55_07745 [Opitutales bacterium]|nr:hypothetical protein [Opitutales bacterium]